MKILDCLSGALATYAKAASNPKKIKFFFQYFVDVVPK